MKLIAIVLTAFFFSIAPTLYAQGSNIILNEDPAISSMMIRMMDINRSREGIEGWRIQLLATTDRRKMEEERTTFMANHPSIKIDWMHEKPYYKLRAGAFTTKLEAMRLLYTLKHDYPSAYPAKDHNINPSELVGMY